MTASDKEWHAHWRQCSLADLIRYIIQTHHVPLRNRLPPLQDAVMEALRADTAGPSREWRAAERLVQQFRIETENHLRKEEVVLFPLIAHLESTVESGGPPPRYGFGSLGDLIAIMAEEHVLTDHQLERLTAFIDGAVTTGAELRARARRLLAAVVEDMVIHTGLEDDILFPRTVRLESGSGSGSG